MKVRKLHLVGYKRFRDLTINLGENPKRIIALVGPNGCGKSSVLDGMLFIDSLYGAIGNKGGKAWSYHSIDQESGYHQGTNEVFFDKGTFDEVLAQKSKNGREKTLFSFRSAYRYNSNLFISESRAVTEMRFNNYGASTSIDLDDKMEENYRRLNIKFNKYLHEADCKPSEAKAKIIGDLNNHLENCLDLKIDNLGNLEAAQGTIYFSKKDHDKAFQFNVLSSGEKEVVDILLDLYLRQDDFDDTIFLLDEPELHINTSIQRKLLVEIDNLIGANCQIWIATHSIGFLRALQEDFKDKCDVIKFNPDTDWGKSSQTLSPMAKNRANWAAIFETALEDLTGLVSPKKIIYCEGLDKPGKYGVEKGFDAKVFNGIFNEKHHDTLFISSGGNTELDQRSEIALTILTKVFSEVEILVLKDRDVSSGRINTEKDREIYLDTNPKNHRMLKRWEIENYLYDKEVLKKFCAENSKTFNEDEYDKYVSDVVNQNLKDDTNRIRNFCGITTSVSAEAFKLKLSSFITEDMSIYKELEECIFT